MSKVGPNHQDDIIIPLSKFDQFPGEMVMVDSKSYHWIENNQGPNLAEAVFPNRGTLKKVQKFASVTESR